MLRKLLFVSILFYSSSNSYCQELMNVQTDPETTNVFYEQIDSITASKEELFGRAKLWITKNFNSAKTVIQSEDKETGYIYCKGSFDYVYMKYYNKKKGRFDSLANYNTADFTIAFVVKENKFKIKITDIQLPNYFSLIVIDFINTVHTEPIYEADRKTASSKCSFINAFCSNLLVDAVTYLKKKSETDF